MKKIDEESIDIQYPTWESTWKYVMDTGDWPSWSISTFTEILSFMGIRYQKISDQDNAVLIENPYFVKQRKIFCKLINQFEAEGCLIL